MHFMVVSYEKMHIWNSFSYQIASSECITNIWPLLHDSGQMLVTYAR